MSMSLGCLLEPATGFTGSLTTITLSNDLACASTSDSQASSVYWLNSPLNGAVVISTALGGCGGGYMTCLAAAHFAALNIPHCTGGCVLQSPSGKWFNNLCDALRGEASIFAEPMRTVMSSSVPLFHLGHVVGALNHIQPSLLFGSLY